MLGNRFRLAECRGQTVEQGIAIRLSVFDLLASAAVDCEITNDAIQIGDRVIDARCAALAAEAQPGFLHDVFCLGTAVDDRLGVIDQRGAMAKVEFQ